ncbi:MAG: alkaline phosphatase family protein [Acidobacteriota bacterium]|nr:alkaline phosphatase family protein [Acidobacteriota bacterium]
MAPQPETIDQLRTRLRALGYLDAPVDRYVLGAAASATGSARFAIGAAIRVGIAAGLLLGISATIALAARAPGLMASRRDALVLGLALSALFTLIVSTAVGATVIAASGIARRSPRLSTRHAHAVAAVAGIGVAIACAAYLALWWNAAQEVLTSMTFGWNLAALAVAAAVSLLLAHAVSVVILAALARSHEGQGIAAGGLLSSRAFLLGFGVLLFAGSAALLSAGRHTADANAPAITVVPTGYALRVIAIDGFDLAAGLRLSRGLPALSRLLAGASLPLRVDATSPPDPARDWTSLATGQPPGVHGITSLEARRAVGIEGRLPSASGGVVRSLLNAADLLRLTAPSITTGEDRRVPAFWEVAAAGGLRTAVVNWWATWPAPDGDAIVITDRALLRLDTGGALDAEVAPPSLYASIRAQWDMARASAAERAAAAFISVVDPELRRVMVRSAELDILVTSLGKVNPGPALDVSVVYLPGLDIAQHHLLQASAASVSAMSERVAAIEHYYRFLDGLIAELLVPSASHIDAVILWPGRVSGREGTLLLAGAPILPGVATCERCEVGAAATLLYLLGLPVADNLKSTVMTSAISIDFLKRRPIRRIASYDAVTVRRSARTGQPLDAEALERLRSLGYIR